MTEVRSPMLFINITNHGINPKYLGSPDGIPKLVKCGEWIMV